jgi:hypothetical protein
MPNEEMGKKVGELGYETIRNVRRVAHVRVLVVAFNWFPDMVHGIEQHVHFTSGDSQFFHGIVRNTATNLVQLLVELHAHFPHILSFDLWSKIVLVVASDDE